MKVETRLAKDLGLEAGELLLDYPAKTEMLGLNLPVQRRDGRVDPLHRPPHPSPSASATLRLLRLR